MLERAGCGEQGADKHAHTWSVWHFITLEFSPLQGLEGLCRATAHTGRAKYCLGSISLSQGSGVVGVTRDVVVHVRYLARVRFVAQQLYVAAGIFLG